MWRCGFSIPRGRLACRGGPEVARQSCVGTTSFESWTELLCLERSPDVCLRHRVDGPHHDCVFTCHAGRGCHGLGRTCDRLVWWSAGSGSRCLPDDRARTAGVASRVSCINAATGARSVCRGCCAGSHSRNGLAAKSGIVECVRFGVGSCGCHGARCGDCCDTDSSRRVGLAHPRPSPGASNFEVRPDLALANPHRCGGVSRMAVRSFFCQIRQPLIQIPVSVDQLRRLCPAADRVCVWHSNAQFACGLSASPSRVSRRSTSRNKARARSQHDCVARQVIMIQKGVSGDRPDWR